MVVGFDTMCVKITVISSTFIPLNRESEHTVNLAAGRLNILSYLAICNIARITPTEVVIPLKHRLTVFINRSDERNQI